MYSLYFKRSNGEKVLVQKKLSTFDEVFKAIHNYISSINPDYKIYYIRSWGENPIVYDVGSHTEFFYLYPNEVQNES